MARSEYNAGRRNMSFFVAIALGLVIGIFIRKVHIGLLLGLILGLVASGFAQRKKIRR